MKCVKQKPMKCVKQKLMKCVEKPMKCVKQNASEPETNEMREETNDRNQ